MSRGCRKLRARSGVLQDANATYRHAVAQGERLSQRSLARQLRCHGHRFPNDHLRLIAKSIGLPPGQGGVMTKERLSARLMPAAEGSGMDAVEALEARIRGASSLPGLRAAAFDTYEVIRLIARASEDRNRAGSLHSCPPRTPP